MLRAFGCKQQTWIQLIWTEKKCLKSCPLFPSATSEATVNRQLHPLGPRMLARFEGRAVLRPPSTSKDRSQ